MTESIVRAIPEGIHTITPHIVVREAGKAAEWYKQVL
jgi:PhnB protein